MVSGRPGRKIRPRPPPSLRIPGRLRRRVRFARPCSLVPVGASRRAASAWSDPMTEHAPFSDGELSRIAGWIEADGDVLVGIEYERARLSADSYLVRSAEALGHLIAATRFWPHRVNLHVFRGAFPVRVRRAPTSCGVPRRKSARVSCSTSWTPASTTPSHCRTIGSDRRIGRSRSASAGWGRSRSPSAVTRWIGRPRSGSGRIPIRSSAGCAGREDAPVGAANAEGAAGQASRAGRRAVLALKSSGQVHR